MKTTEKITILLISVFVMSAYILPHWFIIKESASVRSRFSIKKFSFEANAVYKDSETSLSCDADFSINRDERLLDIKITCDNTVSEFRFKDQKPVSQNIKADGKHFIKALTLLAENEDLILPLPVSSERLKTRICNIATDCSEVKYKRLGGVINYQFISKETGSYYLIEKESLLPSALFLKDKNVSIEAKKYYAFSTNIKFPSVIEIQTDKQTLILNIEDIEID